jgi:UDP:flavonoid glycosyltransferase YjiC (YdhE family)
MCAAAVLHGGANTTLTALAAGVPVVVCPISADQPLMASLCVNRGVGVSLSNHDDDDEELPFPRVDPETLRSSDVTEAVQRILATPTYAAEAAGLREEMASQLSGEEAAGLVERLAEDRQPIINERRAGLAVARR